METGRISSTTKKLTVVNRYQDLDALRGLAAVMVVLFHFTYTRPQARYGFFLGSTGVDMFFIISGFVIFMSINKVANVQEFAVKRFARLFPTYWVCLTISALVQVIALKLHFVHPASVNISVLKYVTNLTMFQHYFGYASVDGSYWTLLVEMLFYICIALLLFFKKLHNIFTIGCIALFVVLVNDLLANYFSFWPYAQIRFWFPLINHAGLFFAGVLLYKLVNKEENSLKLYITIFICYLVQVKVYYTMRASSSTINFTQYTAALTVIFGVFIVFANNRLSFITNPVTLFFGKISYALYLLHQFLGAGIILPGLEKFLHLPFIVSAAIAFMVIVFLAYLINIYIEIPASKFFKIKRNTVVINVGKL